jgi:hypothetical protein
VEEEYSGPYKDRTPKQREYLIRWDNVKEDVLSKPTLEEWENFKAKYAGNPKNLTFSASFYEASDLGDEDIQKMREEWEELWGKMDIYFGKQPAQVTDEEFFWGGSFQLGPMQTEDPSIRLAMEGRLDVEKDTKEEFPLPVIPGQGNALGDYDSSQKWADYDSETSPSVSKGSGDSPDISVEAGGTPSAPEKIGKKKKKQLKDLRNLNTGEITRIIAENNLKATTPRQKKHQ